MAFLAAAAVLPLPDAVEGVADWLGLINLILLGFNMLPALPLDGGRVLRALLWGSSGDFTRATRTAGSLGRALGYAMAGLGVFALLFAGAPGGLWLIVLGLFLAAAAEAEASFATTRAALAGLRVRDAMVREPESVPGEMTVAAFVDGLFARSRHAAYPVTVADATVGLLSYRDVALVPTGDWQRTLVRDVAVPVDEALTFRADDELGDAVMELAGTKPGRALVLDGSRLEGLLSMTDVSRLLELRRIRQTPRP